MAKSFGLFLLFLVVCHEQTRVPQCRMSLPLHHFLLLTWRGSFSSPHLKAKYFGHQMQRVTSLEKTLMLGKTEGKRSGQQRVRWLDGITNSMNMMKDRETWCVAVHGVSKGWTGLSD